MGFDWGVIRSGFFDRPAVQSAVDRGKRKGLSRFGAFVRQRAKTSIRKRKGSAPPGAPPHSHAGQLRMILFSWDAATESVVVGPVPFTARRVGSAVVPKLLEFGGASTNRRGKRTWYAGNPFMRPAEAAERPRFAAQFKGMIQ